MKIRKLSATFGKLDHATLSLHEGLNVIYAPTESGKSTWCAFIQAMLYGLDTSQRAKAGFLPDRQRYAPWSGAPMEGTMDLVSDRCEITISRASRAKNAPMRDFSACYTGTSTPVEGLTEANAGEMLTGVNREVFRRTAFIGQGAVAVTGGPELEKRITSLVSTGEEQISYSEADTRLRAWQRRRRFNRRGLLPALEGRMDETQRRLEEMNLSNDEQQKLEAQLEQARRDCAELEQRVVDSRKQQRRSALDRLNTRRDDLREASAEHDRSLDELAAAREALRGNRFGDRDPEKLEAELQVDLDRLQKLSLARRSKPSLLPMLLCFLLAAILAAVYTYTKLVPLGILAAVFCAAALVLLLYWSHLNQKSQAVEQRRKELLKKYGVSSAKEIRAIYDDFLSLLGNVQEAEKAEKEQRMHYEKVRGEFGTLEESTLQELDFSAGETEAARLGRALVAKRNEIEALSARVANLNGRMSSLGDPLVLASELSCMQAEVDELQEEYEALSLAIETLREADKEIQSRFSPQLGRLAASYMSAMTGGRYEDVLINRDFTARTRTKDDVVARDSEYLSAGTLDLMYLAVRLAICELAMPDGEPCPLILDDVLVNLDAERFTQAMDLLKQIAKERQVILFSCRRE